MSTFDKMDEGVAPLFCQVCGSPLAEVAVTTIGRYDVLTGEAIERTYSKRECTKDTVHMPWVKYPEWSSWVRT